MRLLAINNIVLYIKLHHELNIIKINIEENLIIDVIYKCTEYKKINTCKSFIILNDKKEILKYDSSRNHLEKEYDVSLSIMKHKINDEIEKSSLPSNIITFAGIPSESEYFKTKQAKLFRVYNDDIFVVDTFFIAPKFSYQIFITRTYAKELNSFYTTSFAILKNKEQETILIERYKNNEAKLINAKCDRNNIINWGNEE
ncbi:hypothetical protein H8356DRAFT_1327490 [Neocallimastix lanati (nom. inval.)]|nr:hypothetical protein H8356DRAFT_1327490 [Neocallimastix sp. JGI-2020a]